MRTLVGHRKHARTSAATRTHARTHMRQLPHARTHISHRTIVDRFDGWKEDTGKRADLVRAKLPAQWSIDDEL